MRDPQVPQVGCQRQVSVSSCALAWQSQSCMVSSLECSVALRGNQRACVISLQETCERSGRCRPAVALARVAERLHVQWQVLTTDNIFSRIWGRRKDTWTVCALRSPVSIALATEQTTIFALCMFHFHHDASLPQFLVLVPPKSWCFASLVVRNLLGKLGCMQMVQQCHCAVSHQIVRSLHDPNSHCHCLDCVPLFDFLTMRAVGFLGFENVSTLDGLQNFHFCHPSDVSSSWPRTSRKPTPCLQEVTWPLALWPS